MAIFSSDEAKKILEKVISFSKADDCEVNLNGTNGGNIRYARNSVSTAGENSDVTLVVQSNFGKKSGVATINEFDDASLQKVVRRAEELAQLAPENPEFVGPLAQQVYGESKTFFDSTAKITPDYRAQAAANSINPAIAKDVTAAGYLEDSHSFTSMMNTKGLFAYNQSTGVDFTVTMRSSDGAGTIEFLVDKHGDFYFMEMNTRIQVEHPITEEVTDYDLIKEQIKVAAGVPISGTNYFPKMFAMECRINAEDPANGFRPSPGKITNLHMPGGHGVRIDSHVYAGYTIPPNYDSMIAKLIITGQSREEVITRMKRALQEFVIEGVKTTIPFHIALMDNAIFRSGKFTTKFLETSFDFSVLSK
jgi:hypothetical protein